ncbi:hypothetical protein OsJ_17492 [Oryza sativa Japonica Group]|uniref:CCHC-type domain-containing protein n=1 Tax=Oryza sativa subsp. japonica TaxID=39947 RepID=B9FN09_ORYSJ|nr:hypothetical protein OsJ_17492 [Oryza sativa Japonica Group]
MGVDGDSEFDHLSKKDVTMVIKFMEAIQKQQACTIKKNEEIMSLTEEHKKLKDFHSSLTMRYEKLENEFACATNSIACVASLKKQNQELKFQLDEITNKYVDLQERHDELLCSHVNLVDSHAMLEVSHEVIIATVKSYEPHVQVNLTCANPCFPQANMSLSTICDLDCVGKREKQMDHGLVCIAQPSQDNREGMVNKLEKGSTVACTKIHQRDIKSINDHTKERNQKMIKSSITCFKCKKVGHHVRDCPWKKGNKLSKKKDIPHIKCFKCTEAGHFASRSPCTLDEQCKTSSERQTGNKQTEKQYRSKSRL